MNGLERFFATARERYHILLRRRAGNKPPWTGDPIFQDFRFCNVFREDDRTTAWFRERIRGPLAEDGARVLLATVAFRWFNRIETGERLLAAGALPDWDEFRARAALVGVAPLVTGAYMIKTPAGLVKFEGIAACLRPVAEQAPVMAAAIREEGTLEAAHRFVRRWPFLGGFMAYEVVTDLRHTALLDHAPDIDSWCHLGPGATRGLGRVAFEDPKHWNQGTAAHQEQMLEAARDILRCSRMAVHWPREWPRWEMREVEHWACEYDKYERTRLGEGAPKQRYKAQGEGGAS